MQESLGFALLSLVDSFKSLDPLACVVALFEKSLILFLMRKGTMGGFR